MSGSGKSSLRHSACRRIAFRECFPARVWLCLGAVLLTQVLIYFGTGALVSCMPLHRLETPLDLKIPFVPAWVTVYFLAYLSWAVNAVLILSDPPTRAYRFTCAYIIAILFSGVFFLAWPGTIDRPEPVGSGFFVNWVRLLYRLDEPRNLCPSLHVMASYFCWRALRESRRVPCWYRYFNFIFMIMVCLSILFVKQHALVDIPAAVIVAELSLQAARFFRLERIPLRWKRIL